MPNNIQYSKSPNETTAFVVQEGGQKNRAVLTAPQDTTTLELPDNPNSTKGYVTIDGKKHKVILTADISGNGGGGAVDSVNGKTGVVVLDATDVGAVPQYETMPTADASNADLIVQFVGATDTYTNGYFYKCTGAGEPVVYSWSQVDVQPQPVIPDPLPSQTGQSGKFLTTDGTDASWSDKPLVNTVTTYDNSSIVIGTGGSMSSVSTKAVCLCFNGYSSWISLGTNAVAIGTKIAENYSVNIGGSTNKPYDVVIGGNAASRGNSSTEHNIAIGAYAETGATGVTTVHAIQLGSTGSQTTNSDSNTFKVANANGNFEMMNANGNLPADRLASTTGLADGNYRLRLTMSNGVPTLTWVAE